MSGIPSSQSTKNLKKTSLIRCKTAINRNTASYSNLMTNNQSQKPSLGSNSNRGNNPFLKGKGRSVLELIGNEEEQNEYIDLEVWTENDDDDIFSVYINKILFFNKRNYKDNFV